MANIWETISNSLTESVDASINYIPHILAAIALLVIGLIVGKFVGKVGSKLMDKLGIDKAIGKTALGDMIKTTKMSVSGFIDAIIKWFIYLIFIMASVRVLELNALEIMIGKIIDYLPNLFSGLIVFIGGLIIVDIVADWIGTFIKDMKVDGAKQIMIAIRAFMFMLIAILTLDQLDIDTTIFYTFVSPLAWAVGVIVAFRYGVKDALVEYAKESKKK